MKFVRQEKITYAILAADALALAAFFVARGSRAAMNFFTESITNPLRRAVGTVCDLVPFSVAEGLYVAAGIALLLFLWRGVVAIRRAEQKGAVFASRLVRLAAALLTLYTAFTLLWGANYYADGFREKSGLAAPGVAPEELVYLTLYFASGVNDAADDIYRHADGTADFDLDAILAYAPRSYEVLYEEFPFLRQTDAPPKPMVFSRIMSALGFTGFYFPFTGESNVNVDFPAATLPATVVHELAHRRGIASEQECNFLSVLASIRAEDASYRYAGWLSGFIYLGNALYSISPELYNEIYRLLDEAVQADLRASREYWAQFESPVEEVATKMYDGMLKGYGEPLGVQSYGACVDLLAAYFRGKI